MAVASISESLETTHIGTEEKNSDLFLKINVFTLLFELCIYYKIDYSAAHGKRKKILVLRTTHMQMYFFLTLLLSGLVPNSPFQQFAKIYTVLISWFKKNHRKFWQWASAKSMVDSQTDT